jgi:hypothetical protein
LWSKGGKEIVANKEQISFVRRKNMTDEDFAIQNWENEGGTLDLLEEPSEIDSVTAETLDEKMPQTFAPRG